LLGLLRLVALALVVAALVAAAAATGAAFCRCFLGLLCDLLLLLFRLEPSARWAGIDLCLVLEQIGGLQVDPD
jgi:hypothetical protein